MGLHSLPSGLCCSEVTFSTKPLRTVEDFKGLKMRTIGAFADVLTQYFGASPVVMPGSEVYTALERGAIDAADWSGPSENMTAGLHEAARYVIYPGPQTNAFFMEFVMDAARWDALPDNIKVEIEAATRIATMDTMMLFNQADMRAWEQLKQNAAAGTNEIVRMDDATVEAFRKAGRELANKIADEQTAKGNPWMRRVVDSYYAYYDYWLANSGWRAQDWQASN
jgi:TRAP-type mannitol/chloroaromatic compound transport system substrate-binding protein